jgi:S1-C subfamily serine protease
MELATTFEVLRPSIVALASRVTITQLGAKPVFPFIVGTGFVVDESGLVVTNRHVAEALRRLPRNPKTGESSAMAVVWAATQDLPERKRGLPLLFPGIHAV